MKAILLLIFFAAQLTHDSSTGAPGQFAADEIQRELQAKGLNLNVALTVDQNGKSPQGYRITREGQTISVIGTDAAGAMYGGLDIAEAIRNSTLDSLKSADDAELLAHTGDDAKSVKIISASATR